MRADCEQNQLDLSFGRFLADLGDDSDLLFKAGRAVSQARREGHVCVALEQIDPLLGATEVKVALLATEVVGEAGAYCPLIVHGDYLYLQRYFNDETRVVDRIHASSIDPQAIAAVEPLLQQLFPRENDDEVGDQQRAALSSLCHSFSVISGGPGTGKTTTVAKVLALHVGLNPKSRIQLAAPTGKAATRLQESLAQTIMELDLEDGLKEKITLPVMTIHRLLGFGHSGFRYNAKHPLGADLILIDEASMVDLPLMADLVQAMPPACKLILLGDQYQLASVQPGAVLGEICTGLDDAPEMRVQDDVVSSERRQAPLVPAVVTLNKSYRFQGDSGIRLLSDLVKRGDGRAALEVLQDPHYGDVALSQPHIADLVEQIVVAYDPDQDDVLAGFTRLGVLCCHRTGPFGVKGVNEQVTAQLHQIQTPYHGMPLMILANDHGLGLYNGDTGVVVERKGRFYGCFKEGGALRYVLVRSLPAHTQAYAITVHKSQGSEYDRVAFLLPQGNSQVLCRELVYTAITRAKKSVMIYGEPGLLVSAISKRVERVSGLARRLFLL